MPNVTPGNASATASGMVTTGSQTFAGAKTFSSTPTFSTGIVRTGDGYVVYHDGGNQTARNSQSAYMFIARNNSSGGLAVGVFDYATGVTVLSNGTGCTWSAAGNILRATHASGANISYFFFDLKNI